MFERLASKRSICAAIAASALLSCGCDRGGFGSNGNGAPPAMPNQSKSEHSCTGEQVTAKLKLKTGSAKPGDFVQLTLLLEIKPGWDLGTLDAVPEASATRLNLELPPELETQGDWLAPPAGRSLLSDGHAAYAGQVEFTRTLVVNRNAALGNYQVQCRIDYQVCNDRQCIRPAPIDLVVTVKIE